MTTLTISVVITTYNRPLKLMRCIEAAHSQHIKPHEVIVVNDGSTMDYSQFKLNATKQFEVIWVDQPNGGVSSARNLGASLATGAFVAFCDDDDYWLPNHITVLTDEIIHKKGVPGIYHTYRQDLVGHTVSSPAISRKPENATWQEHYVTRGEMILCCTCMHRDITKFSPFPTGVKYAEDHEQRLIALEKYPCFPIEQRTVIVDRTDESATNRPIQEISRIYRRRFQQLFANPHIRPFIRYGYRQKALFRWTSLELSEASISGQKSFLSLWLTLLFRVRSMSNAKTMLLQLIWHYAHNRNKQTT